MHGSSIQTGDLNKPIKNTGSLTGVSLGTAQIHVERGILSQLHVIMEMHPILLFIDKKASSETE